MVKFNDLEFKVATACGRCKHCVAVAYKDGIIGVRNTQDPQKVTLQFSNEEWQDFILGVKNGEFDFPFSR